MIKLGRVAKVNKNATVQVVFEDRGDFQSQDIQVMHLRTGADKHYHMPVEGEDVVVGFFENCPDRGIILGSLYTNDNSPPASDDRYKMIFKDGTSFEYDKSSKTATLNCVGKVHIKAAEMITLEAPLIKIIGEVETTKSIKVAKNGDFGGNVTVTGAVSGASMASAGDITSSKGSVNAHYHIGNAGKPTSDMVGG